VKIDKTFKILLTILICISVLSLFTPLTFTNVWVRNFCFVLTVLLSAIVGLRMKQTKLKYILIFSPLTFFLVLFLISYNSFANRRTDMWRTSWISHRKGISYVAGQMLDIGGRGYAHRTVKIIRLTPLFDWVTKIDTVTLDKLWTRTFESFNPYNLK
jgi:hypothetical protein